MTKMLYIEWLVGFSGCFTQWNQVSKVCNWGAVQHTLQLPMSKDTCHNYCNDFLHDFYQLCELYVSHGLH